MSEEHEQSLPPVPRKFDPASPHNGGDSKGDHNPEERAEDNGRPEEIGGRAGPDPTRYGDWEKAGRCVDF